MIQVNRIYLILNRLVTKKFLVDTSDIEFITTSVLATSSQYCRDAFSILNLASVLVRRQLIVFSNSSSHWLLTTISHLLMQLEGYK